MTSSKKKHSTYREGHFVGTLLLGILYYVRATKQKEGDENQ